jgi:hypothetical protein
MINNCLAHDPQIEVSQSVYVGKDKELYSLKWGID